jgi:hypothetical protein
LDPVSSSLEDIPMTSQARIWRQRPLWVPGHLCCLAAAVGAWQGFSRPSLVCHNQIKNRVFFTSNITTTAFGNRSRHAPALSHQPRHIPRPPTRSAPATTTSFYMYTGLHKNERDRGSARRVAVTASRNNPLSRNDPLAPRRPYRRMTSRSPTECCKTKSRPR